MRFVVYLEGFVIFLIFLEPLVGGPCEAGYMLVKSPKAPTSLAKEKSKILLARKHAHNIVHIHNNVMWD